MVFAIGAVLVARPFVTRKTTLLVAIPLAALVGVLVLGGIALIVAFVILLVDLGFDPPGGKKKAKAPVKDEAGAERKLKAGDHPVDGRAHRQRLRRTAPDIECSVLCGT